MGMLLVRNRRLREKESAKVAKEEKPVEPKVEQPKAEKPKAATKANK